MNVEKINSKLEVMKKSLLDWQNKLEEAKNQVQLHNGYIQALRELLEANTEEEETDLEK